MTLEEFKATVTEFGGEKNLLGLIFDNNMKVSFTEKKPFSYQNNLNETISTFFFEERDVRGNIVISTKHIENLQGVLFVKDEEALGLIASRYILP